jgi:hypothetical protein
LKCGIRGQGTRPLDYLLSVKGEIEVKVGLYISPPL